ncbi:hypothetical protein [Qipengyuania sphaerica]|uniref:hypothetical protein n=1 Tax=Qipengyuania sphaerica TaxID=2867243 RepID=UPI001C871E4D|nr:hypothetical protein [Qipengyuania sphaerica]MBX7541229.1 hypothetical protein [Qipengyuania sphaerica]
MRLRTRSIALEVRPSHKAKLVGILVNLRGGRSRGREGEPGYYPDVLARLPTCHFLSLCVFESADYDPTLVIEANYDGDSGPFWACLQHLVGDELREALRCCKRPLDHSGKLYDSITEPGSRRDPAPFLECHVMRPKAFFHGNRGMPRDRILAEASLANAVQDRLGNGEAGRDKTAEELREGLRTELMPKFPWLAEKPKPRIPLGETALDWLKLAAALFLFLHLCLVPGAVIAGLIGDGKHALLLGAASVAMWAVFNKFRKPLEGVSTTRPGLLLSRLVSNAHIVLAVLAALFLFSWPIVAAGNVLALDLEWSAAWKNSARQLGWGIGWLMLFILPGLLVWMRYLERHDSSQEAPQTDPVMLRQMVELEDWIPQNHMASVVSLRPNIPRRLVAYVGTLLIHLALRAAVRDGYLGSMRTIHCAHWAFINNGSRMLFLSNFDLSWEAYFDDFIEKAHEGVTAIWGGSVGFPPTTMLIEDGAAHGRAFKRWARHSMSPTRFWVSAYPDLTVDQIERNNRIANGLCARRLSPKAANAWAGDL